MASFTGFIAQAICVGDPNARDAMNIPIPTSCIYGPFPTQVPTCVDDPTTCNPDAFSTPGDVINRIMQYAFPFAGIIIFIIFVSAGYDLIMSKGDANKLQAATKKITSALIGFGVLIVAYVVVKTLALILGFQSPV